MTPDTGTGPRALCLSAIAGAVFACALFCWAILRGTGGVPEYPLDDVYIHLAIAEQIAAGNYGINAGEVASAGSSALYPLLLVPLAGTALHAFMPLAWNVAALLLAAWIFGLILWRAGVTGLAGIAMAAAAPLCLNMGVLATAGMEHMLHLAVSLALLWGVRRWCDDGRLAGWLWLCVALGPLLRPEGLALSLCVALVVTLRSGVARGFGLAAVSVLPLSGFLLFLRSLGLPALPSSVTAKLDLGHVTSSGPHAQLLVNLTTEPGLYLMAVALVILAALLHPRGRALWPVVAVSALPILAHLSFGQVGWYNRYEGYALSLGVGAVVLLWAPVLERPMIRALVPAIALLVIGAIYLPGTLYYARDSARGVHLQQAQMARFAKTHLRGPVAVNDIGHVARGNPHHVLDLYGLANPDALAMRLSRPAPGWGDAFVRVHGVDVAMLYAEWMEDAVAPHWIHLGDLRLTGPTGVLGGDRVAFYVTRPEALKRVRTKLDAFAKSLPEGAFFEPVKTVRRDD